jgi:4'-phosphopantetheinyl transferase
MIDLYAVKLAEPMEPILFQELLKCISSERRETIRKFHTWKDAHRSLIAELMLRSVLNADFNVCNDEIVFERTTQGKPFLRNHHNIHFNLSHSGSWILCGFGDAPVGVDVEELRQVELDDVSDTLSPEELKLLSLLSSEEQRQEFFRIWTLKESYAKALGQGTQIPFRSLSIRTDSYGEIVIAHDETITRNVYFQSEQLDERHPIAVCSFNGRIIHPVNIIGIGKLVKSFIAEPAYA